MRCVGGVQVLQHNRLTPEQEKVGSKTHAALVTGGSAADTCEAERAPPPASGFTAGVGGGLGRPGWTPFVRFGECTTSTDAVGVAVMLWGMWGGGRTEATSETED